MAKYLVTIAIILLILFAIFAGCIVKPPGSTDGSGTNQQQTKKTNLKTTAKTTAKPTTKPGVSNNTSGPKLSEVVPLFNVGQIAAKSSSASTGLAIVDYNTITGTYGTKEVKKNSAGDGWYTDGYQLIVWKSVASVDKDYKYIINTILNPANIPEYDATKAVNVFLSTPCDLVGDWKMNNGISLYKFRMDNIVVNKTGNQTKIGDWVPVKTTDKRSFVIRWRYGPSNYSANYMEKITISSDYSKFDSTNNYGTKISGQWIGIVPAWKAELDKAKPDKQAEISSGTDCYKWLGGNEWYNKA